MYIFPLERQHYDTFPDFFFIRHLELSMETVGRDRGA